MPRSQPQDQLGFDEQVIDDPSIESALEERLKRKHSFDAVRKTYEAAHEIATAKIAELELPEGGAVRVGRFRITRQEVPAGHREFDTKASSRVRISLVKEGAATPLAKRRIEPDQPPAVH
jgi:hypothetical protein